MSGLGQATHEGFKQTEVGIIPEEWEVKTLGDIASIERGKFSARPRNDPKFFGGATPFIQTGDITRSNGRNVTYSQTLNSRGLAVSRLFPANSLYFTIAANIGDVAIVNYQSACPDSLVVIKQKQNIDKEWLYHFLSDKKDEFEIIATSNAQLNINLEKLNPYKLSIPSKKEQTAIANALSDVDALLTELEKLIAKKQAIKTATMQQLLTGKTRLPEFAYYKDGDKQGQPIGTKHSELGEIPEDWEVVCFGELFEQSTSRKNLKANTLATFIGMQDVSENAKLIRQISVAASNVKSGFTYFEKGDVLVAKITPCFENGKGCHTKTLNTDIGFGSTEFHVLKAKHHSDSDFIYYWTTRDILRSNLEREMVGSAGHRRVPFSAIQDYPIPCPSTKQEQTEIANILSDMDSEIQTLEQRLKKTRQIKQGMMQELLTGRTRLPFDAPSEKSTEIIDAN